MSNKVIETDKSFFKKNRTVLLVVGLVGLLLLLAIMIEGNEKPSSGSIEYSSLSTEVKAWYDETKSEEFVITVIGLSYCGFCEQYKPVLTQIANDNNIKLHWFNIDELSQADSNALQNTYELKQYTGSSPYTLITYGGEFIADEVGYMEKESVESFLKEAGVLK